ARVTEHVTAAARDRVALFVGELCNVSFPEEGNPILQAARQNPKLMRDNLRRALLDFLAVECSAAPVLLVLDDLQWSDELTVSILDEAMREQAGAPLFILALARPEVSDVFPRLWSSHRLQKTPLKGLSKKACERLIQQVLGKDVPPNVVDRAVEQSGGNALFLEELIRLIAEGKSAEQPETVLAMLQARLGRLDPAVRGAVRAAAVFGQTFWLGGVAALLDLPKTSPEIESWLSALVDAELIEPHPSSRLAHEREYGFRHALIQAAAYSLIAPGDLGSGHHLAGQFLEVAGEQDASMIAEQFERSGAPERAAALYAQAAEQSYVRHDIRGILLYSDRALACGATGETLGHVRALQAVAYLRTDDLTRGFDAGMEALEHLPQGSPVWLRTLGELLWTAITLGRMEAIQQLFGLFSRVDPATSAPGPYILTASTLISVLGVAGQRLPAKALLERMLPLCDRLAAHEAAPKAQLRMAESYYIYTLDVDAYRALLCAHQAAEAFTLAGDLQNMLFAQQVLGRCQARLGAFEDAEQTLRNNVELGHRLEAAVYVTWAEIFLAQVISHDPARLTEAAAIADRIRSQEQRNVQPPFLAAMYRVIARSLAAQGQLDEAEAVAREAVRLLVQMPVHRTETLTILAHILLQNGRRSEAQEVAEEALKIVQSQGGLGYTDIVSRVTAAELRSINGDLVGARAALEGALTRISLIAEKIPDAGMRQQFLTRVTENVRAQQLAQEWGLDLGGPIVDFPSGAKHH
ncbi:MAG TPA: hypothetical protein VK459_07770, partial [Polyangiaceae bacterium]|nr:hypothetical protein [Polyangiaceae bacterium]